MTLSLSKPTSADNRCIARHLVYGEQKLSRRVTTPSEAVSKQAIASIAWKHVSKRSRKQGLQAQFECQLAYLLTCLLAYQEAVVA